ncbi:S-layer homology domain-containing protein [Rubeoparvulum massiliense]|uniref:S-layer homology domain-containing protein n=1 Tax=Rubeoparvulum massiliense TaxID=1631346 RepID=UPI00065DFCA1|nr:S-layer homology domain-containing protein [Rubeoparvulum massiliense]
MKKVSAVIIVLLLLSSIIPAHIIEASDIGVVSDIKTHWAKDTVNMAITQGWVNGYEDHTFKPNRSVSRQEFIKIIISALGYQVNVSGADWYVPYVEKALHDRLITQDYYEQLQNVSFGRGHITRGEVTQIAYLAYAQRVDVVSAPQSTPSFKDTIPNHLTTAVATLVNAGVITGYPDNTFKYAQGITRAETVVVIERLLKLVDGDEPAKDGISINEMMSTIADTIPLTVDIIEKSGIKEKSGKEVATMDDFYRVVGAYFGFDKTYEPKYVARVPKLITPDEVIAYQGENGLSKDYMKNKLQKVKQIIAKQKVLEPVIEKIEKSFYNEKGKIHVEILGNDREKYDLYAFVQWTGGEWIGQSLYEGFEDGVVDFEQQYGEVTIVITDISGESHYYKMYRVTLPGGSIEDVTREDAIQVYMNQKKSFEKLQIIR